MRFFALAILPAQSSQVPALAKNVSLDCGEDRTRQNGPWVLPVLKVKGDQMRFIAHLHPCGASGSSSPCAGATPTRASAPSSDSATASAAAAAASTADVAIAAVYPTDQLFQCGCQERSHVSPNLQLKEDGLNVKWHRCPGRPHILQG